MVERLIQLFNDLNIPDMEPVVELHELAGSFINLNCQLPNGETARLLDDSKTYYGTELCKAGSSRCYGLAADEKQLLVYEYGEGGSHAELVIWKKINPQI